MIMPDEALIGDDEIEERDRTRGSSQREGEGEGKKLLGWSKGALDISAKWACRGRCTGMGPGRRRRAQKCRSAEALGFVTWSVSVSAVSSEQRAVSSDPSTDWLLLDYFGLHDDSGFTSGELFPCP